MEAVLQAPGLLRLIFSYQHGWWLDSLQFRDDPLIFAGHSFIWDQPCDALLAAVECFSSRFDPWLACRGTDGAKKLAELYPPLDPCIRLYAVAIGSRDLLMAMGSTQVTARWKALARLVADKHGQRELLAKLELVPADPETQRYPVREAILAGDIAALRRMEVVPEGALEFAARHGHLNIVEFLHRAGHNLTAEAMDEAAAGGHVHVLRYLSARQVQGTLEFAIVEAAKNGYEETVAFLLEAGASAASALSHAVKAGHAACVRVLVDHLRLRAPEGHFPVALITAAVVGGHEEVRTILHPLQIWPNEYMDSVAAAGRLDLLESLHASGYFKCSTNAMDLAAANGHLAVLRFLHEQRQARCSQSAMDGAAAKGHMEILKYLHETCHAPPGSFAIAWAAMAGHLDAVRYLNEVCLARSCDDVAERAASSGHLDVVKYANDNNLGRWSHRVLNAAAKSGNLALVQYLHAHRPEGCTTAAVDNAAERGHADIVEFLLTHRTEGGTSNAVISAVERNHGRVVALLASHGFNVMRALEHINSEFVGLTEVGVVSLPAAARFLQVFAYQHGWWHDSRLFRDDPLIFAVREGRYSPTRKVLADAIANFAAKFEPWLARHGLADAKRLVELYPPLAPCVRLFAAATKSKELEFSREDWITWQDVTIDHRHCPTIIDPRYGELYGQTSAERRKAFLDYFMDDVRSGKLARVRATRGLDIPPSAINLAALHGHRDIVMHLHQHGSRVTSSTMDAAAAGGHLSLLRFLHAQQLGSYTTAALASAVAHGHANIARYLLAQGVPAADALLSAVRGGHLDCVELLIARVRETTASMVLPVDLIVVAVNQGFEAIRELLHPLQVWSSEYMDAAARAGCLHLVQFLHNEAYFTCSRMAVDMAATNGHLDVVRFLCEQRGEGCSQSAVDRAAGNGHLDVVVYLTEHHGIKGSHFALAWAAVGGHLNVVRYLHEMCSAPVCADFAERAARGGHLDVVCYASERNLGVWSSRVLDAAAKSGNLKLVQFLHSQRSEGCTTAAVDFAIERGHVAVAHFLLHHRSEGGTLMGARHAVDRGYGQLIAALASKGLNILPLLKKSKFSFVGLTEYIQHKQRRCSSPSTRPHL
ncbi:hypothetical protein ACHHYP_01836 [Achlya hypogyna]|uniref:Ankyrin repeat protein n=1 Tax=Achlya hypogyna TaxID=1202772 RepID=A0A1V9ZSU1_ACHHY|nr:hypothetical protein ACHHYP_01836 [Achlya hypogyna]